MKNLLTHGHKLAVAVLLAWSWPTFGQSLGQPSGEIWMGQPLDVTIPARFHSTDDRDTCVHADVAYGGNRLDPSRVRTTVIGEDEHRRVRIASDVLIDEPLVTVTLRAGCGSSLTRRYALLPDMPSEAVLARLMQPATAVAMAAPIPGPSGMLPARADLRPEALRLTPATARMGAMPRVRKAGFFGPRMAATAPRLRLDAIEADAGSLLRVSAHLSGQGDPAMRARAALLWQAISADPQDLVRSNAALEQLENELAQLRRTAGSTRSEMASLRQRIDEAQPWYLSPRAVQVLALLVLAAAAASALFARQARRAAQAMPWYTPSDHAPVEPRVDEAPLPSADVAAATEPQRRTATAVAEPAFAHGAVPLAPAPVAQARAELPPLAFEPGTSEQAQLLPASSSLLRVETLAAILEEVEFLASLGLHSDAMDVLKAYLQDSASPAPVAFFELMRVCSLAEDTPALEAVRRRYAKVLGVQAPTLAQVTAGGGLEQQRALAERVTRAWGTAEVLSLIEHALFDVPAPNAALPIEAARDLICLYDIAMLRGTGTAAAERAAPDEPLAPWAHAEHLGEAQAFAQAVAEDVGGHRFALDIDLTVVPEVLPDKAPEPEPQAIAARLVADKQASREAAERAAREAEDAFNAAVASERAPISRY